MSIINKALLFTFFGFTFWCNISYSQVTFEQVMPQLPHIPVIADMSELERGEAAAADVDNDGDLDYIISGSIDGAANYVSTELYLNQGNGQFLLSTVSNLEDLFYSDVTFADVDGDSDQDLLLCGLTNIDNLPYTGLYLNDGLGAFTEVSGNPIANMGYSSAEFADIDGDLDLDLIIGGTLFANFKSTKLYVNDGIGGFTENTASTFVGIKEGAIRFNDFDLDGDQDVFIVGDAAGANTANIYMNDGTGLFTVNSSVLVTGLDRSDAVFKDLNGDIYPDLLVCGRNDAGTSVAKLFQNDGAGNLIDLGTGGFPANNETSLSSGDYDNDGDLDILLSGNTGGYASRVYRNDGSMSFTLAPGVNLTATSYGFALFFDCDQDSFEDVLIGGRTSTGSITKLYRNDQNGNFNQVTGNNLFAVSEGDTDFGDVDGDGDLDLFISGSSIAFSQLHTKLYLNDGNAHFTLAPLQPFSQFSKSAVEFADFEGDADLDLIISGQLSGSAETRTYLNDGAGNFTMHTYTLAEMQGGEQEFFDCDSDGDLDLFICGGFSGAVLYLNDGAGNFTASSNVFTYLSTASSDVADIDLDGDLDIAYNGLNLVPQTLLYSNDGAGNYSLVPSTLLGLKQGNTVFFKANNDAFPDLLICGNDNSSNAQFRIYLNDGAGNFSGPTIGFPGIALSDVMVSDIEGDNDLDILFSGQNNSNELATALFLNNSFGNFTGSGVFSLADVYMGSLEIADMNNDGDKDILVVGQKTVHIEYARIYENTTCMTFSFLYDTICAGSPYTFTDGVTIPAINNDTIYHATFTNGAGCDSIVKTYLQVKFPSEVYEAYSFCDSVNYTFPDGNVINVINADTTYISVFVAANGCDSLIYTNIIINNADLINTSGEVCYGGSWVFPDGSVVTNLLIDTVQQSLFTNSNGCDSVVITSLVVHPIQTVYDTAYVCYGSSWIFPDTSSIGSVLADTTQLSVLEDIYGCDSLIFSSLVVIFGQSIYDTVLVCAGTSWIFPDGSVIGSLAADTTQQSLFTAVNGCDSIIYTTINLLEAPDISDTLEICYGSTFIFPDGYILYDIQTDVNHTSSLLAQNGCDSIITIYLEPYSAIDTGITKLNSKLIADNLGALCQWFDCDDTTFTILYSGNVFQAPTAGFYAAIINENGCTDTSNCYEVSASDFYNETWYQSITAEVFSYPVTTVGSCDAHGFATVNGGVSPYNYNWLTQIHNNNLSQLDSMCDGIHILKLTDALGDTALVNYYVADTMNFDSLSFVNTGVVDTAYVAVTNCALNYSLVIDSAVVDAISFLYPHPLTGSYYAIDIVYWQSGVSYSATDTILVNGTGNYLIYFNVFCDMKSTSIVKTHLLSFSFPQILGLVSHEEIAFKVYPNPASNAVTVSFSGNTKSKIVQIFDGTGRLIYNLENYSGTELSIDCHNWNSGMYWIAVSSEDNLSTKYFIKL